MRTPVAKGLAVNEEIKDISSVVKEHTYSLLCAKISTQKVRGEVETLIL